MDLNVGMDRTGIEPNEGALELYQLMNADSHVDPKGLHAYDGHIRNQDFEERKKVCDRAFEAVTKLRRHIESKGIAVASIVAGGSPSFPVHVSRADVEVSPGTTLLWDARYAELFPDMGFEVAAVLLTRIVSKPAPNILCFDLGHKSIAPEMDFPRILLLGLEDGEQIGQSEEHLVVRTNKAEAFEVGDTFYAIPMHICPTVAKYEALQTVIKGEITDSWEVIARGQKISI